MWTHSLSIWYTGSAATTRYLSMGDGCRQITAVSIWLKKCDKINHMIIVELLYFLSLSMWQGQQYQPGLQSIHNMLLFGHTWIWNYESRPHASNRSGTEFTVKPSVLQCSSVNWNWKKLKLKLKLENLYQLSNSKIQKTGKNKSTIKLKLKW